ncbi:MAG: DUF4846 domain-containing protein [Bacteroidales bacterium]|nr:DUF4846 domain-containing protein [Bacteroidales bacterium]
MKNIILILLAAGTITISCNSQNSDNKKETKDTLIIEKVVFNTIEQQETAKYTNVESIPVPKGYTRIEVGSDSYGKYLRNLELKTEDNIVYLYTGELKYNGIIN